MSGIKIIGMGKALPRNRFSNDDLSGFVETSDEWITSRTGIRQRYIMEDGESLTDLAAEAAQKAMQSAGITPDQVGLILAATCTSDYHLPSLACAVQQKLGIHNGTPAFDVNAACSGFIYGLEIVHSLRDTWGFDESVHTAGSGNRLEIPNSYAENEKNTKNGHGTERFALLLGAEQFTKMLDFRDRSTCVLFGDGAACAVIRRDERVNFFSHTGADGCPEVLYARSLGYNQIKSSEQLNNPMQISQDSAERYFREAGLSMDGSKVFKFAVSIINEEIDVLEKKSGISARGIDYIVCHQANYRIIDHVRRKRGLDPEKFFMNLQNYGNTSAASIPLALCEMREQGLLREGTKIFCVGFGAGLTWAGAFLEF